MSPGDPESADLTEAAIRDAAARWVVRRDRGLSRRAAAEFERWLKADPRHAAAVARSALAWKMLDRLPAQAAHPVAAKFQRRGWRWAVRGGLAAAAAGAFFYAAGWRFFPDGRFHGERAGTPQAAETPAPQTRVLADGTLVRLNQGAVVTEVFTPQERRVRLMSGEAFFTVTKDSARPFVVEAREVTVRAVGTAFNVRLQDRVVDVLVTEGTVRVKPAGKDSTAEPVEAAVADDSGKASSSAPFVTAGQRAVIALTAPAGEPAVVISKVPPAELATALAWSKTFMRLGGAPLAELIVEFQRRTGTRVILADPALADLRVGGRFPSDNVEDFIRVLAENYGISSAHAADGTLILGKAP